MKNAQKQNSQSFYTWLVGIVSSLKRWFNRLIHPNHKRSGLSLWMKKRVNTSVGLWDDLDSKSIHIKSVLGLEQFRNAESLPIGDLMSQVQWRLPKQSKKSVVTTIATAKENINWD